MSIAFDRSGMTATKVMHVARSLKTSGVGVRETAAMARFSEGPSGSWSDRGIKGAGKVGGIATAVRHAFERGVGEGDQGQVLGGIDEPAMAIGATPPPCAERLGNAGRRRIAYDREGETIDPAE